MHKLYDFMEARERLSTVTVKTKLIHSDVFSQECGNDVYIKPENLQITGSFKVRGAYNKISKLSNEEKERGVIAASAGNHAQGVALAAKRLGIKAVIAMPKHTPLIKVKATKQYGAEVVLHGEIYDEAYQKAVDLQKEKGYVLVHPFDDEDVIEGQGTIALEVLEELPDADVLLVPVGGGGLVAGIAAAAKLKNPQIKVIGVEPEGAASALAGLKADHPVPLAEVATIADGTAVRTIGSLTLDYIKEYVDEVVTVSDYELMESFLLLVEKHKLVAENAGILSLAGLKKLKCRGKKVVSILSGGNIDVLTISSMINKGLIVRGRIFTFSVNLPDKPGQLVAVSELLAREDANVIKLDHNQFKNLDRFHEVELQVTVETNGEDHIRKITEEFEKCGYKITRLNSSSLG
ncbi:threonine ammonia-lyase [Veillonella sp. YH-vei2232]|mgnify:CR=1 FL=1|jgi:threonine dehydratase|uniref:threonine ammonia-lyase n=1 Tax=Veillonella absiana TaxID=3079305 RepID=A0ABU3ZAV0_9FIRM|nr:MULTISPECIES: threonine ammonia-lyase [unclassified Veillonella]MBP9551499.1 threonine ammonia-lyase [Veillonella sp.]MDV5063272.1 threonine ammonia-lyase [Veillonella sp. YH-vei2232]MDV5088791.1 threonine ammonia-lyase [Veillonella sp. YH-vei2233]